MKKSITGIIFFLIEIVVVSQNIFSQEEAHPRRQHNKHKKNYDYSQIDFKANKAGNFSIDEYVNSESVNREISDNNDLNIYERKRNTIYEKNSDNYFRIEQSENSLWNGKHWIEKDFPLKIYIKKSSSRFYKSKFIKYIDYSVKVWSNADGRITFQYVNSYPDADIVITFIENLMEKYSENYLGLTDYDLGRNKKIKKSLIEISLLKFNDEIITDGEIKSTIVHEFGHALGLGHSNNDIDIMYPYINPQSSGEMEYNDLSAGDIDAVKSVIDLGSQHRYSKR